MELTPWHLSLIRMHRQERMVSLALRGHTDTYRGGGGRGYGYNTAGVWFAGEPTLATVERSEAAAFIPWDALVEHGRGFPAEVADLERIAVRQTDLRGHADARVEVHRLRAEEDLILARILDDGQDPLF